MKILENDFCIINYSDSLQEIIDKTLPILKEKLEEYKKLFNIEKNDKVVINYFDDLNEFREFIYNIRGNRTSLPDYAKGTYDNGMINAYISKEMQDNQLYYASHELFHILYSKYGLNNDLRNRIVWYDEGMAKFISGEDKPLKDENKFINFYKNVKENTKIIPNLNVLKHGKEFYNDYYNAYQLSYLSIRYLYEILSKEEFNSLLFDIDKVKEIGNNIVYKMFEYYDNKYLR